MLAAVVDLPSRGTEEVNITRFGGLSTSENRIDVRMFRMASVRDEFGLSCR